MSDIILNTALSDFNIDKNKYDSLSRSSIEQITNEIIQNEPENRTLTFSQRVLLNGKKKNVSFDIDSPEYQRVIANEKENMIKRQEMPSYMEYVDICVRAAARKRSKTKIDCKKYL